MQRPASGVLIYVRLSGPHTAKPYKPGREQEIFATAQTRQVTAFETLSSEAKKLASQLFARLKAVTNAGLGEKHLGLIRVRLQLFPELTDIHPQILHVIHLCKPPNI